MAFSFGATAATPAASSGFSFGAAPAPTSSFGFGANPSAPAGASSGFSFGTAPSTATATSATPASGFNFGTNAASATSSLCGAPTGATGFGFGSSTQQPPTSGFGGFNFSALPLAAPQSVAGPPITLETAFEELPDEVKKNMMQFLAFLKEQDQLDAFLKTVSSRPLEVLRDNMAKLEQEVLARRNRQARQTAAVQHVRHDVRQLLHQVDTATLTRRSLDNSSHAGALNVYHVMRRVEMPSRYYWELLDHYEHKMAAIKAQIEDVEAQVKPLYDGRRGAAIQGTDTPVPARLQQILLAQNTALMQAAARVAEVHEKAEEMRQLFLAKMQDDMARHGDTNVAAFQNPFDKRKKSSEADKRQAIDKIRFRTSVAPTIVASQPAAATPATSAFGFGTATPAAAPAPAPVSGFSFGGLSAPAKTVSFNLTSTTATSVAPLATTTSITATPLSAGSTTIAPAAGGFMTPTVATSGFGGITSSFLPPAAADGRASVGSKRGSGRAHKKR
uniref:Nucleoporin Nup54 alpha-helical domain-containing protein n=1 Tax=Peronospora matthiolae TaxID=2874970 RepID=A0AAV1TEV4_9STRA